MLLIHANAVVEMPYTSNINGELEGFDVMDPPPIDQDYLMEVIIGN